MIEPFPLCLSNSFAPLFRNDMILRRALALALLLISLGGVWAQRPGGWGGQRPAIGKVYGKVLDATTKKGVEFATVSLLSAAKDSVVGGALAESNGDFAIDKLPFGAYRLRIAFLGYVEFKPRSFEAGVGRPGVAWSGEDEQVLADIAAARTRYHADLVIPFLHWGWEEEGTPSARQRTFARAMLDAGADMVVGAHPHVTQGADIHGGKPIVYSLGNFLFNGFDTEATRTGWTLEATLDAHGVTAWRTRVVRLDDDGVPHPDPAAESPCGRRGDTQPRLCHGP